MEEWPLIGRDGELALIAEARAARSGVVLSAPAGMGKSRLAREAVAAAGREGAVTEWIQATRSAASVPLGAFAGLIPADARTGDPLALMRRSVDALRERDGGRDVVIGVDDAQLLDPTSAALVLHMAMTGAAFVIATVRAGEASPDAVKALWKDAGATRIDVQALTEQEVDALLERVLGGPVEQRVGHWVFGSSQGNALYVRELLTGALDGGALVNRNGFWRLAKQPPPSSTLAELVTSRMEGLGPAERRVVELLALGEPLRLSEMAELTTAESLSAVEVQGVVTVAGPAAHDEVRLAHPLYGEVVRTSMPVTVVTRTCRELARAVGERPEHAGEDALRIARWLLDAGDEVPSPLLLDAAHAANISGDPDLGEQLAMLALDGGAGADAALVAARALVARNRYADAEEQLARWEGRIDDRDVAIAYLQQRTMVLNWGLQRMPEAMALVGRAEAWWPDAAWRRRLDALRVQLVSIDANFSGMVNMTEALLSDPELDPSVRHRLELVHLGNLFYGGRAREAHDLLQRRLPSVPLQDELDELAMAMTLVIGLESGIDVAGTQRWMHDTLDAATRRGDDAAAGIAASTLGGLSFLAGRNREAIRWFEEAVTHLERHDPFNTATPTLAALAGARYQLGDLEGVASALRRCRAASSGREVTDLTRAYVIRGQAWEALADGDPPRAQRVLLEGAQGLTGAILVYAAQLYHEALRAGAPARQLDGVVAALRERCDAPLVAAYADHVAAAARHDGRALLASAEAFAAIGFLLYAAECAAEAASAFAAEGRQDSARRAAARCRELHALGQDGQPPEIRGLADAEITLTAREAQLVELAARGLSNAEIAERLVLSRRTVESHLYRAMQKLGVSTRKELRGPSVNSPA